ncbi:MAG: hypothetical protein V1843_03555 [bacterium]
MIRSSTLFFIFYFLSFIFSNNVSALRPLETDNIRVLGMEQFAMENGYYHIDTPIIQIYQITETFKIGIPADLELGIEIPYTREYPWYGGENSGVGDTTIRIKKQINDSLGYKIGCKLANGNVNRGLGSGTTDVYLLWMHDAAVGPSTVSTNVGYNIIEAAPNTFRLNMAWYIPSEDIFALVGEINAESTLKEEGWVTGLLGARAKIGFGVWDVSFRRYFEFAQNTYGLGVTLYN